NCTTSKTVTRTTVAANRNVIRRAISSPLRNRERNEREPVAGPAFGTVVVDVATVVYWIEVIAFNSFATTSLGSLAYSRSSVNFCPSVIAHFTKPFIASRLAASENFAGMSSQVNVEIGYAFFPGAFVMDTRKSSGIVFTAPTAASLTPARSAFTKTPAAFF